MSSGIIALDQSDHKKPRFDVGLAAILVQTGLRRGYFLLTRQSPGSAVCTFVKVEGALGLRFTARPGGR
jgi:hypothetical protein